MNPWDYYNNWAEYDERCKPHGKRIPCSECYADNQRKIAQQAHEDSVRRQRAKIKRLDTANIVPRRTIGTF